MVSLPYDLLVAVVSLPYYLFVAVVVGVLVCYSSSSSTVNPGGGTTAVDLGSTFVSIILY